MQRGAACRNAVLLTLAVGMSAVVGRADPVRCRRVAIGRVSAANGSLRVAAPGVARLETGDVLLQLNGRRLRTCDDLAQALREARAGGLDVLLLVERDGQVHAVHVELPAAAQIAAVGTPQVAADVAPAETPPGVPIATPTRPLPAPASPTVARPTAVPTPIGPDDAALVREALAEANAFGRELQDSLPLPSSQPWLGKLRRLLDAQAERRARGEAVAVVEPILAYYKTVGEILVYKEEVTRNASRQRNRLELILEYDSDCSEVNGWLRRYPFLAESVVEPPEEIHFIAPGERPGRWLPNRAIELLIERALAEGRGMRGEG